MHERRVVDHDEQRLREEPLAINAILPKRGPMPEVTRRCLLVESRPYGYLVGVVRLVLPKLRYQRFSFRRRFVFGESRILCISHIAKVADDIHDLVIAERHVHATAGLCRLRLETHDEIHHAP